MSIRNLDTLFSPRSVVVIGAFAQPSSVEAVVLRNLVEAGFAGPVFAVAGDPAHLPAGVRTAPGIVDLPQEVDLALLCAPSQQLPGAITALGRRGCRAAVLFGAGAEDVSQALLDAARPFLLRLLGPDSMGLLVPALGLNASIAASAAAVGKIAFVSQSGTLASGILDWAGARRIGFSKYVALGDGLDVDFGDVLDYLAGDGQTQSILLYVEQIRDARKFVSAARAAARSKPTIVVKAGRAAVAGMRWGGAGDAENGVLGAALGIDDAVHDAVFRRAGMLRVRSTEDLFAAAETLTRTRRLVGNSLTIVTNGHGPGLLGADALAAADGHLAQLSEPCRQALGAILPPSWSGANPVDILGDADPERYWQTLQTLLHDPDTDAVLVLHAPTALVRSADIAQRLAPLAHSAPRNILTSWLGGASVARARQIFLEAGIPTYDTAEEAVNGYMQLVHYRRNQELLMQVPASIPEAFLPDRACAHGLVRAAIGPGGAHSHGVALAGAALADMLNAYGITLALDVPELAADTRRMLIGVVSDPVFGPLILCAQGGSATAIDDFALALPPLNMVLARDLVLRTRIWRGIEREAGPSGRERQEAILEQLCHILVQISHLVGDVPELTALRIRVVLRSAQAPLLCEGSATLAPYAGGRHLAIRPYPSEWEQRIVWQGQDLLLRPIRPEDGFEHEVFFHMLDPEDVLMRMFTQMRELSPSQLARMTQIDYDREMAFVAARPRAGGGFETLGVARVIADPDNLQAEFAVAVRSDLKGKGLGTMLMQRLITYCKSRGTGEIVGEALARNKALIALVRRLGFEVERDPGEDIVTMRLRLGQMPQ